MRTRCGLRKGSAQPETHQPWPNRTPNAWHPGLGPNDHVRRDAQAVGGRLSFPGGLDHPVGPDVERPAAQRHALALDVDVADVVVAGGDDPAARQDGRAAPKPRPRLSIYFPPGVTVTAGFCQPESTTSRRCFFRSASAAFTIDVS
jgi:hypothetical protein